MLRFGVFRCFTRLDLARPHRPIPLRRFGDREPRLYEMRVCRIGRLLGRPTATWYQPGMPHLRSSLGRRDPILLAGFVALWLFCWGFSAASILGGSRYPALLTGVLEHPEAYPVVTGFLPWL